ncbi:MAG: hypothetical protein R6X02_08540 [Enhygromyxa sp.]
MTASLPRPQLVRSTPNDRFYDYCLQPYAPREDPRGKLRGESLLWNSLAVAGLPERHDRVFHAIQRAAGRDMTVFGVKWFEGRLSWELYFYDPEHEDPQVSAAGLREGLAGELEIVPEVEATVDAFMVSFDLDHASLAAGRVEELNLYLPFFEGQGGHSYAIRAGHRELRNSYRFHHPKREIEAIVHQIRRSVYVDFTRVGLAEILLPELFECAKICVAKKRFADAVYYSGISVDQLLWFLRRFAYPEAVIEFVTAQRDDLRHLLFDVGVDYCSGPDGRLRYPKSSYYSTF